MIRSKISIGIILSLFLYLSSCTAVKEEKKGVRYIVNIDSIHIKPSIAMSLLYKKGKTEVIFLDTVEKALFVNASKLRVCDDKIVILDRSGAKKLFVFDRKGKFIRQIGSIGEGPGEFFLPDDFAYSPQDKSVYVLDHHLKKIFIYNLNTGGYLRSIPYPSNTYSLGCYGGHLYTNGASEKQGSPVGHLLKQFDKESGKMTGSFISPELDNAGWSGVSTGPAYSFMQSDGDKLRYVHYFTPSVFEDSGDGVSKFLTFQSKDWITAQDLEDIVPDDPRSTMRLYQKKKFFGIYNYVEKGNKIFCTIGRGAIPNYFYLDLDRQYYSCGRELTDDIFFDHLNPQYAGLKFQAMDQGGAYYMLMPDKAERFLEHMDQLSDDGKRQRPVLDKIRTMGDNFNGALFYYEFKE